MSYLYSKTIVRRKGRTHIFNMQQNLCINSYFYCIELFSLGCALFICSFQAQEKPRASPSNLALQKVIY
jgi:hypothetical protein